MGTVQGEGGGNSDSIAILHVWSSLLKLSSFDDFLRVLGIILWKIDRREWGIIGLGIISWMLLWTFIFEKSF